MTTGPGRRPDGHGPAGPGPDDERRLPPSLLPALVVRGTRVRARAGRAMDGVVVGAFTDAVPDLLGEARGASTGAIPDTAAGFRASIDWGDTPVPGLPGDAPAGEIRSLHLPGEWGGPAARLHLVTGSHTYQQAGTFPITVTITAADGRVAYLTSMAQVRWPPPARGR